MNRAPMANKKRRFLEARGVPVGAIQQRLARMQRRKEGTAEERAQGDKEIMDELSEGRRRANDLGL